MDQAYDFDGLAGVRPGVTTLAEVREWFGAPERSTSSDGGNFLSFNHLGIRVCLLNNDSPVPEAIVDEVLVTEPYAGSLGIGLYVGQQKGDAIRLVQDHYLVRDLYEDAIYFYSVHSRNDLLASVEFLDEERVNGVELMYYPDPSGI